MIRWHLDAPVERREPTWWLLETLRLISEDEFHPMRFAASMTLKRLRPRERT
jgi:hypothetical protein